MRAGAAVARLVGDEQLDRRPEDRIGEVARSGERLELVTEIGAKEMVDGGKNLRPGAVVQRQRQHHARLLAPFPKDVHVGVAEAVDRLELVPDEEHVLGRLGFLGRR